MTSKGFLQWLRSLEDPYPLFERDKHFDGGCPCFRFYQDLGETWILVQSHCWRICRDCPYAGVHVTGTTPWLTRGRIAKAIQQVLEAYGWPSEWAFSLKPEQGR
jgi:hypothetical protein